MTNRAVRCEADLPLRGPSPVSGCFRRQAIAALLSCRGGLSAGAASAMRLAICESLVRDVNATGARAAIGYWIRIWPPPAIQAQSGRTAGRKAVSG